MEQADGPGRGGHYDADNEQPCSGLSREGLIAVSEDPLPPSTPDGPTGPATDPGQNGAGLPDGARLAQSVLGRFSEQARQTAGAARARRVVNADEPGVLDLTPLRELLSELSEELGKLRLRNRIGRTLRQAADIIDPPA